MTLAMRYYIETSVLNFLHATDVPERAKITEQVLGILLQQGPLFTSDIVVAELSRAPAPLRQRLLEAVTTYRLAILPTTPAAEALAERYLREQLFPPKYRADALHAAVATVHEIEVLLSWNFEHLVKLKSRRGVNAVNQLLGYHPLEIVSPEEVT